MFESHDESAPREVKLLCDGDEMISVQRAFLARTYVPLTTAADWCDAPFHNHEHCVDFEDSLTNELRMSCNTHSVCSRRQYYTELPKCGRPEWNPGTAFRLYIHVDYECVSSESGSSNFFFFFAHE